MPPKFAFDLDGCVVDFMPIFLRMLQEKYGVQVPQSRMIYHTLSKCLSVSIDVIQDCVGATFREVDSLKAYPGSIEFLEFYYKETRGPLLFITDRLYKKDTFKWLDKWLREVPFQVIFTGGRPKIDFLLEGRVDVFVEDRAKTALQVAQKQKRVLLPDRCWNRHLEENCYITRVQDWNDIEKIYNSFKKGDKEGKKEAWGKDQDESLLDILPKM